MKVIIVGGVAGGDMPICYWDSLGDSFLLQENDPYYFRYPDENLLLKGNVFSKI